MILRNVLFGGVGALDDAHPNLAGSNDLHLFGNGYANHCIHPVAQLPVDFLIPPVARDDLPGHTQTGGDEAVLPVAVGGLVQVHEVHVDLVVGYVHIVLGGQITVKASN